MLPLAPPALLRPADDPSPLQAVLLDFQAWIARESARGVPFWNPMRPPVRTARTELPGATVVVWGDYPPLETETQEVLRLTVAWLIANRFNGRVITGTPVPTPENWLATHPGGNRIPGNVPLGWRR